MTIFMCSTGPLITRRDSAQTESWGHSSTWGRSSTTYSERNKPLTGALRVQPSASLAKTRSDARAGPAIHCVIPTMLANLSHFGQICCSVHQQMTRRWVDDRTFGHASLLVWREGSFDRFMDDVDPGLLRLCNDYICATPILSLSSRRVVNFLSVPALYSSPLTRSSITIRYFLQWPPLNSTMYVI
jgi:hypothetical protein